MILYHVSTDLLHNGYFEPRIPENRHHELEDSSTPRVSVSTSIEGCFTAMPLGGGSLETINTYNRGYYLVFTIDTEKLGIQDEHIITSKELYEQNKVQDVFLTDEYWITTSFQVPDECKKIVVVNTWEYDIDTIEEYDVSYEIRKLAENAFDGYIEEAWDSIYGETTIPIVCCIENLEDCMKSVKDFPSNISLYFESEEERLFLMNEIKRYHNSITIDDEIDYDCFPYINIYLEKKIDLTDIITRHWLYVKEKMLV